MQRARQRVYDAVLWTWINRPTINAVDIVIWLLLTVILVTGGGGGKAPLKWSVTLLLVATLAVAVDWIFCLFDAAGWLPKFRLLFEAWWPNKKNTD